MALPSLAEIRQGATSVGSTAAVGTASLLNLIGEHESGGDYNVVHGGGQENLTGSSINEVLTIQGDLIKGGGQSAAGKYQIQRDTLRGLMTNLGLTGDEPFDEAMQDRLATELMKGSLSPMTFPYRTALRIMRLNTYPRPSLEGMSPSAIRKAPALA